jgi:cold shock CspA family protein
LNLSNVRNQSIRFYGYDATVRLKDTNLSDDQFVSFSVVLDVNRAYAANVKVINEEYQFTGRVWNQLISLDDYDGQKVEFREFKSANLPHGQAVSFSIVWEGNRAYAVNVKAE